MKPIINRQARAKYEFLDDWEAGLVLTGAEVKSVKKGQMNLKGAYVGYENGELWLKNAHISAYQQWNQPDYEAEQPRKLLLRRKEIDSIMGKIQSSGLTIIPEKVYSKSGLLKVSIRLARGLKKHDKREKLKKKDTNKKINRALKQQTG